MNKSCPQPVLWTIPALNELDEIAAYHITREESDLALIIMQRILAAAEKIGEWPGMARQGRVAGTRELVIQGLPYIIVYREKKSSVSILRVLHTSRDEGSLVQ